jgi:hypothetical protein
MARRGGRPRKPDRTRARAPRVDRGTPELQQLRQLLVGKNDLELTPLGALVARDLISREAHDSGVLYGALTALSRAGWSLDTGSLSRHYRRIVANDFGLLTDSPEPSTNAARRPGPVSLGWTRSYGCRVRVPPSFIRREPL